MVADKTVETIGPCSMTRGKEEGSREYMRTGPMHCKFVHDRTNALHTCA